MKRVEADVRYVEDEVRVWMPRPRRMSSDSVVWMRRILAYETAPASGRSAGRATSEARCVKRAPRREVWRRARMCQRRAVLKRGGGGA